MKSSMLEEADFVLPGAGDYPQLRCAFVRWRPRSTCVGRSTSGAHRYPEGTFRLSLILLHCVGIHKETWQPTIEHLFEALRSEPDPRFAVVEAWAMDAPQHGHAASLNAHVLLDLPDGLNMEQWNAPLKTLLASGLIEGDRVVGVGHSAGALSLITTTIGYQLNCLPFSSVIMVEPPMMTPDIVKHGLEIGCLPMIRAINFAKTRKDIWSSRDEARAWFGTRSPWRRWDQRVFDLFVRHGLHDLPTAAYPERHEGVTLACTRAQDSAAYTRFEECYRALDRLTELCASLPVHAVLGDTLDMVPAAVHEVCVSEKDGRRMKSIRTVSGAGHLAVQDNPRGVALEIWRILEDDYGGQGGTASKL
ncbi:Alpha/beta hydrolase family-domain-containing protein [Dichomitus squalens]|uniref:Alpha/beta hydrolase family-domain-containing protein n=1 Tax=Dichomitus squalens TaxID=114155 RepID=A0A4Q9PSA1_9APHY|nr:Alpha/beta hydrolase family-domain-containing protein [Dichomitus squalens]